MFVLSVANFMYQVIAAVYLRSSFKKMEVIGALIITCGATATAVGPLISKQPVESGFKAVSMVIYIASNIPMGVF